LTKVPYNVFIHGCHSQTCLRVFSEEVNEKGGVTFGMVGRDRAANGVSRNKSPGRVIHRLSTTYYY